MASGADLSKNLPVPRPRPSLIWLMVLAALVLGVLWRFLPIVTPEVQAIGGPFELTDASGRRVTNADLAGKPYAVFFGYTHCPDVCPTTLQDMTDWLKALGPDAGKLRLVFVTVDPARDTPAALTEYMKAFDPRILALTGTEAEIGKALMAFRVYAKKVDVKGADYAMDHTAAVYLMDRAGALRSLIGYGEKPDAAIARLKELIDAG